ncbi:hypothetical protein [Natrinema zhouii]|uniref:hypothetical protein n=1 Tax=Natrinema zhouii TaxID=1710539 RepID=UPI003CE4F2B7
MPEIADFEQPFALVVDIVQRCIRIDHVHRSNADLVLETCQFDSPFHADVDVVSDDRHGFSVRATLRVLRERANVEGLLKDPE